MVSLSQLSIDVGVKAAIGCGISYLSQANLALGALILATQSVAQYALTQLAQAVYGKEWRASTIEDSARAVAYLAAIVALKQAELVSLRVAGLLGFFTMAFFLGNRFKRFETAPIV